MAGGVPWTVLAGGILLTVRLTPRGGRDAIDGVATLDDGRCVLKARVRTAPTEGEANDALVRLVAGAAGVAPRAVTITAGATSRVKTLKIEGDGAALTAALERMARDV